MAWYNAPLPQPDHTLRAVKTALAIREAVEKLHKELPEKAHLDFGVGIHYGEAVLGWIGTEKRLEYTTIGDSINTTKRIQENSSKNQILMSKDAYERVKNQINAKPYAPLTVKGKTQPIEVYEGMGLRNKIHGANESQKEDVHHGACFTKSATNHLKQELTRHQFRWRRF